jgi:hypothetical protein
MQCQRRQRARVVGINRPTNLTSACFSSYDEGVFTNQRSRFLRYHNEQRYEDEAMPPNHFIVYRVPEEKAKGVCQAPFCPARSPQRPQNLWA